MSNNLTFKNGRSYFTLEDVNPSSNSFTALKDWAVRHCCLKVYSDKEFIIENDNTNQIWLRGCRMFAIKRNLKVSKINPLEIF